MESIAHCYADSLFALAKEEKEVEAYTNDIHIIREVFEEDKSFVAFFSHVLVDDDIKYDLIDKSFKGKIKEYSVNFLKVLIKKRRFRYILDICKTFQKISNEYLGIEEGILYTGFHLKEDEVKEIEQAISKKEAKTIILRQVVDKRLIGGIKVEIHNRVYDGSIQNKVEVLRRELLRK